MYSEKDFCNIVMSQLHSRGCKNTGRAQACESQPIRADSFKEGRLKETGTKIEGSGRG